MSQMESLTTCLSRVSRGYCLASVRSYSFGTHRVFIGAAVSFGYSSRFVNVLRCEHYFNDHCYTVIESKIFEAKLKFWYALSVHWCSCKFWVQFTIRQRVAMRTFFP